MLSKAVFPGSRLSFLKLIERPRYEDLEITYEDANSTFAFMGSGLHTLESNGSDISWYLGTVRKRYDLVAIKKQMDGRKGQQLKRVVNGLKSG